MVHRSVSTFFMINSFYWGYISSHILTGTPVFVFHILQPTGQSSSTNLSNHRQSNLNLNLFLFSHHRYFDRWQEYSYPNPIKAEYEQIDLQISEINLRTKAGLDEHFFEKFPHSQGKIPALEGPGIAITETAAIAHVSGGSICAFIWWLEAYSNISGTLCINSIWHRSSKTLIC